MRAPSAMGPSSAGEFHRLAVGSDPDDAPGKPEPLQRPDHPASRVDLDPTETMKGGGRERVVIVVPRLPEGEQREPPDVARFVVRFEATPPPKVADRVDRPGDVMQQEDSDCATP